MSQRSIAGIDDLRADDRLAPHLANADALCAELLPGAQVVRLLRHVPRRRAALLVAYDGELAVCKVFGSPRARGNHRRLVALATSEAAPVVPRPIGVDASGHVGLVCHVPGVVLDECTDEQLVQVAGAVGRALRRVHDSDVVLDRAWTLDDELAQLERRAPDATAPMVAAWCASLREGTDAPEPLVASHRDCHPKQLVITPSGDVCWIDLDDAAMAPRGLDVGNFAAHLRRDALLGARPQVVAAEAVVGFLTGYGLVPDAFSRWVELSTLRLAGLATTRHARLDWTDRLIAVVAR